jgi:hypothetical protein
MGRGRLRAPEGRATAAVADRRHAAEAGEASKSQLCVDR